MELLAVGVVLFLLLGRPAAAQEKLPEPKKEPEPTAGDVQDTLKGLAALAAPVAAGAKMLLGAVTGGGGSAAVGTAGTAGAGAGAAGAGAALVGPVMVMLLANPFAWIVYVAIATIISKHQEESKNFDIAVWRMGANARALCNYERQLWDEFSQTVQVGGALYRSEVRDYRLDWIWNAGGGRVNMQGWRTILDFVPAPTPAGVTSTRLNADQLHTIYRRIRAAALVYLQERARLGAAVLMTRMSKQPPEGFGVDQFARASQYERLEPGLGGLDAVPLLDGRTVERREIATDVAPPVAQLVGVNTDPDFDGLFLSDLQAARMAALLEVVTCFRYDQLLWLEGHEKYTAALYKWIGQPEGVSVSGANLVTDAARYGGAYSIDVRAAREGTSPVVRAL